MNILIIDIGTSSMRGILFSEDGKKLSTYRLRHQPEKFPDGRMEQNPQHWTDALETITAHAVKEGALQGAAVDAIAVTAQRSAVIPVDREGKPLMNTIMWQDRRNAGLCRELEPYNDLVFEKSGARINTVFSGSRMMWVRRNCPEICENLYKFVNIPEYVMHYMTGNYITDTTYASRSHLMNLKRRTWDPQMLDLFEIREEELCTLQEPGSIAGTVNASFASRTGVPEGIPVLTCGGDQQCAAIGQGAFREGSLSLVAGTGGFLVTAVREVPERLSPSLICNCSSVRNQYMIEANVLTCCSAFDWYCRNFYDWELPQKSKEGQECGACGCINYSRISQDLEALDGTLSTALVLPYFQGRSTPEWNPTARAVFGEISLATGRSDLLKGILEGIFMEIQNNIRLFADYSDIRSAYISGGMTNSRVINQLQADIYGIPLCRMEDCESTALGAWMVAAKELGLYTSIEAAFEQTCGKENQEYYQPREDCHKAYEEKRKKMNLMYDKLYSR